jgi:predicted GIY-YIG superfamily endonuclease
MLRCADGSFYVGVTSALDRRIASHNLGVHPKAYTYSRRPVSLVFSQEFSRPGEAIAAEKQLKGWSRAKKIALIAGDWDEIRRLATNGRVKGNGELVEDV